MLIRRNLGGPSRRWSYSWQGLESAPLAGRSRSRHHPRQGLPRAIGRRLASRAVHLHYFRPRNRHHSRMQAFVNLPIRTQRLQLRPLRDGDVDRLFEIHSDPRVMRYWSTSAWQTPEPARAMIAKDLASATREYLRLGIELTSTGQLVGTCTLFGINAQCRRAEVGYVLASPAWGHGYMNEALSGLIDYAFDELNLNRIEADIDPRNGSSCRVLERLKFSREGYLRERWIVGEEVSDTVLYGLLQREWKG